MIIKQSTIIRWPKSILKAVKEYKCEVKWKQEFRPVTVKPIQAKISEQPAGFFHAGLESPSWRYWEWPSGQQRISLVRALNCYCWASGLWSVWGRSETRLCWVTDASFSLNTTLRPLLHWNLFLQDVQECVFLSLSISYNTFYIASSL